MPSQTQRVLAERYELIEPIGKGGMGTVWRAQDRLLKRPVAVKEVGLPGSLGAPEADALRARVMREARAAARLSHPGAVAVYDVVEEDERPWIVMQLVEAPTLEQKVRGDGPLPVAEVGRVAEQLLDVLEAAHASGIVHRDLKPGNVMVPAIDSVKLTDFGIATLQGDPKITATGLILGSPSYMAPEQAQHATSGPATDVWALGATLYFALEGKPPFDRGQAIPTLTAVVSEPVPEPERAGDLGPVLLEMLDKDPNARPDVATLRARFARGTAAPTTPVESTTPAVPTTPAAPTTGVEEVRRAEPQRDTPWVRLLGGVAALALAVAIGVAVLGGSDEPQDEPAGRSAKEAPTETEAVVPKGWVEYSDPSFGYTVSHPEGWTTRAASGGIDLVAPDLPGTYLRIGATDEPGDDVMARLRDIATGFASARSGYSEVELTETDYKGFEAGLWEYTYTEGGLELHAYNLQFVTGEHGFALNFQTTEDNWAESQDEWEAFLASFEAP